MTELLVAQDLAKLYRMRPVLRGVSLSLRAGDMIALFGENGAGKTTLLRICATLLQPDRGSVWIEGKDPRAAPASARAAIGAVLHQTMIYGDLSGRENLLFHAQLHGLPNPGALADQWLERMQLRRRAHDRARHYSRGMLQRVSIARALLHGPRLLLLDEPYTGLDQASADLLGTLLREFVSSGGAVLMSTHETGRGMLGVTGALRLDQGTLTVASHAG